MLVHCKKGISRSSSTVIAYIMKEYDWPLQRALDFVKEQRKCITPNSGFMNQLHTFAGMLAASRNRRSAVFNKRLEPGQEAGGAAKARKRCRGSRSICEGYLKAIIGTDSRFSRQSKAQGKETHADSKPSPLVSVCCSRLIVSVRLSRQALNCLLEVNHAPSALISFHFFIHCRRKSRKSSASCR